MSSRSKLDVLAAIIERERPDALLPTMGGQTALNLAVQLADRQVLDEYGVELIGAKIEAIRTAENRDRFKEAMTEIGLSVPESGFAHDMDEALEVAATVGFPLIVRPSFILGGAGTGIATHLEDFRRLAAAGLAASPVHEILVERSIAGWKEFELEVMRDHADNCVVVCSIENFDPMGIHTGDSITVAPAQTLSDVEYQRMRDAAFACIRRVGVETGGSNIQFAVDPRTGGMLVIEMNPRVSRSSALASKATGFPIAKIAARLAVGYRLDEIANDITKATPACFEPTIDYVVTKVPRWAFEKLPGAPDALGTRMQSVGEAMAIGRTFPESLQKALRGLELNRAGLNADRAEARYAGLDDDELLRRAAIGTPDRPFQVEAALRRGFSVEQVAEATAIDPWFLDQIAAIVDERLGLEGLAAGGATPSQLGVGEWRRAKRLGFADAQIAYLFGVAEERGPRGEAARRRAPDLQDRRHLRRRVRRRDALLLRHLRGRGRGPARPLAAGRHPRIGSEPYRSGDRVRLLLRARLDGLARGRLRDRDGQLQPGDRLDRLRHLGPALLRADHGGGRPRHHRGRDERRRRRRRRRDRRARGPDAPQARRPDPPGTGARYERGRDRHGRGPRAVVGALRQPRDPATRRRHRRLGARGARNCPADRLSGARAAELCARRPRNGDRLRRRGSRSGRRHLARSRGPAGAGCGRC